ncbi:MAG: hypothetical protein IT559_06375 [Alphaproteobacteria bacterium]|nr:hypothetical protein [Alphaproteobacteria bacterium]
MRSNTSENKQNRGTSSAIFNGGASEAANKTAYERAEQIFSEGGSVRSDPEFRAAFFEGLRDIIKTDPENADEIRSFVEDRVAPLYPKVAAVLLATRSGDAAPQEAFVVTETPESTI